jgi:hypothetical protein
LSQIQTYGDGNYRWVRKRHSLVRYNLNARHDNLLQPYAELTENTQVINIIQIKYTTRHNDSTYNDKVVYDSYKLRTLNVVKDYFMFIIAQRYVLPNDICKTVSSIKHPLDNLR